MVTEFQSHYIPNTVVEQKQLLDSIGLGTIDDLFQDIPDAYRNPSLDLPGPVSELDIQRELGELASRNRPLASGPSFLGAGCYHHFIPAIVKALMTRGEFLTAYTPYQPEVSQGTLQVIFEFQTMISALYGMEVANAGMYDGATSLAEATLMACRVTGRNRLVVCDSVAPSYRQVIATYCQAQGIAIDVIATADAGGAANEATAGIVAQYPNFFGTLDDLAALGDAIHGEGGLLVVSADPLAMGMLRPPGAFGADIVAGEGQPLGIPPSFGGPYLGLFSCKQQYIRQMPSRLVGRTTDTEGRTGYVLTLQTREQHIRRERATSNICTNEALYALASSIYLAAMGRQGLRQVAELCYHKSHYAAQQINNLPGYSLPVEGEFFQEFVVSCPTTPSQVNLRLMERNILGGLDVSDRFNNGMLLCVTEMNTKSEIDQLVDALATIG